MLVGVAWLCRMEMTDTSWRAPGRAWKKSFAKRADFLWRQDGDPPGGAEEYWDRALTQHLRERAYFLWCRMAARKAEPTNIGNGAVSLKRIGDPRR